MQQEIGELQVAAEVPDGCGDHPRELIVFERDNCEAGAISELSGYGPSELVVT